MPGLSKPGFCATPLADSPSNQRTQSSRPEKPGFSKGQPATNSNPRPKARLLHAQLNAEPETTDVNHDFRRTDAGLYTINLKQTAMSLREITKSLRFLLLQVRNPDDPMIRHEIASFARVLEVDIERIGVFDLLHDSVTKRHLEEVDVMLLGGSGHYSAAGEGEWLERALDSLRLVHDHCEPTFASCWGFQAMARAMGGRVTKDLKRAEVGTHKLTLTDAGKADPLFAPLGDTFLGQMGHEDCVDALPKNATLLASSERVINQAYRFDDAPIYCTQFHPELNYDDLLVRVTHYPEYIERVAGIPQEQFGELLDDTTPSEGILKRFIEVHFGG